MTTKFIYTICVGKSITGGTKLAAFALAIMLNFAVVGQTTYYVNDASTSGDVFCTAIGNNSSDGLSSATPKLTLKNLWNTYGPSGTNVLAYGDIIKIDAGVYSADGGGSTVDEHDFIINVAGLTFEGAGMYKTFFDHNNGGMATDYFMYISANDITIKDLTIQEFDNNGTQTPAGHSGQALTVNGATGILIENVIMQQNGASGGNPSISVLSNSDVTIRGGGGLCNVWHTAYTGGVESFGNNIQLKLENYIIAYNFKSGAYDGGGLLIVGNATNIVNVSNCRFYSNEASDGGAISQRGGILTVTDCVLDGNMAGQISTTIYGGGVRMTGGTATYRRTIFSNSSVGAAGGTLYGGAIGIYSLDAAVNLTLDSCLFVGNAASRGTDLYTDMYSAKTVTVNAYQTTFSNAGGTNVIYNKDANVTLTNCGNPGTTAGSPAVVKTNTTAPSYTASPAAPTITSGDCNTGIVLPVSMLRFGGICNGGSIELYWQTASEVNNAYFIVTKSEDGVNFEPIGMVYGSGNANTINSYSYTDNNASVETYYYKLIQVDYDGRHNDPGTTVVSGNCAESGLQFSSVGINDGNISISFISPIDGPVSLSITDILGRSIFSKEIESTEGFNEAQIQVPETSGNVFLVTLENGNSRIFRKVLTSVQ